MSEAEKLKCDKCGGVNYKEYFKNGIITLCIDFIEPFKKCGGEYKLTLTKKTK